EFPAIRTEARLGPAVRGYAPPFRSHRALRGERLDVDLERAREIRPVREPAPVGRDLGVGLVEFRGQDRAGLAPPEEGQGPDVEARLLSARDVEKKAAVRRESIRVLVEAGEKHLLGRDAV